jgi:ubiquinone/menaquinone biosynthesis C-methylase UbiE
MTESHLAALRQQIAAEYAAAQQGLQGLASGTARHHFIRARNERFWQIRDQLVPSLGEQQATHFVCTIYTALQNQETSILPADENSSEPSSQSLFSLLDPFVDEAERSLVQPLLDLPEKTSIIDIGCRSGQWVINMAQHYPHSLITGVENTPHAFAQARMQAAMHGLSNVRFFCQELHLLSSHDKEYDFTRAHHLFSRLAPSTWLEQIAEVVRITRPGGTILITELCDFTTNQPASLRCYSLVHQAMEAQNRCLYMTQEVRQFITALFTRLGCIAQNRLLFSLDISYGTKAHTILHNVENGSTKLQRLLTCLQPLLVQAGVIDAQDFEMLSSQIQHEAANKRFRASWSFVVFVARRGQEVGMTS